MSSNVRPQVVIVGAGFGGLWAARTLAGLPVDVVVLDRNNYHTFLPLLYQVAAAELEPEEIAYPVRSILRKFPNTTFIMAEVTGIDREAKAVETDGRTITYDYLVLALGSVPYYFGVPGASEYGFALKTLEQGTALRNHILCCFEQAANETDTERRLRLLTFAIVGGGPTGVEYAGALAELIQGPLAKDYPMQEFEEVQVLLLEAADSLLSGMPQRLRDYTVARLRDMGVGVHMRTAVSEITSDAVHLKDGSMIPTETVVWTAGVQGDRAVKAWGLPTDRTGRVTVLPTLQAPDDPDIYVVGDLAYVEEDGRPLPMIAPVAVQEGVAAARNIARQVSGQPVQPFKYRDKGAMATIGRNSAVVRIGSRTFAGLLAWVLWLSVHIVYLIGFRNRLLVMFNWSLDYFLFERAVRLIFPSESGLYRKALRCASKDTLDERE